MTHEVGYTIRMMAARCRMTAHTLRYYERIGLIQAVARGRNGHRRYSDADEAWLTFLQSLRATHMPIREIQRFAALRQDGVKGLPGQRKVLEEHRRSLEEQVTKLKEAMSLLAARIEVIEAEEHASSPSFSPLSGWEAQDSNVRRGKLLDFEASRGSAFAAATESEA